MLLEKLGVNSFHFCPVIHWIFFPFSRYGFLENLKPPFFLFQKENTNRIHTFLDFFPGTTDSRPNTAMDEMISGILSEMLNTDETKVSLLESGRLVDLPFLFI